MCSRTEGESEGETFRKQRSRRPVITEERVQKLKEKRRKMNVVSMSHPLN